MAQAKKRKVNTNKKDTKKNSKSIKKDNSAKALLVIFLALCVVVFVLAIVLITQNAEHKNERYDIKVPLTKEELADGIDIKVNMNGIEKNQSKEYRIQLKNYIENKINEEAIKYQIKVSMKKTSKIDVELYSSEKNYELLDGKKKIKNLRLEKDKKEKIVYTLKLVQRKIPSKDEYVNVKITEDK